MLVSLYCYVTAWTAEVANTLSYLLAAPQHDDVACPVQDVGLVFLSAMATSIAAAAEADGQTARQALGTALVTLSIATALVGVFAILIGARCS